MVQQVGGRTTCICTPHICTAHLHGAFARGKRDWHLQAVLTPHDDELLTRSHLVGWLYLFCGAGNFGTLGELNIYMKALI